MFKYKLSVLAGGDILALRVSLLFWVPLHILAPACKNPPELINQENKLELKKSCRNPWKTPRKHYRSNPLSDRDITLIHRAFLLQKLANVTSLTVRVRQPSPPSLEHFLDSRFLEQGGGGGVFSKAPAARQIYTALKNNKPRWMLGWVGRSRRQGNHLRGREPWGIEEKEASEYVFSSAKPISKWLPAPCAWKLKRENRKI